MGNPCQCIYCRYGEDVRNLCLESQVPCPDCGHVIPGPEGHRFHFWCPRCLRGRDLAKKLFADQERAVLYGNRACVAIMFPETETA